MKLVYNVNTVDGNWSLWSSWTECSITCGLGATASRERACTDPLPKFGGKSCPCQDPRLEVWDCDLVQCPRKLNARYKEHN